MNVNDLAKILQDWPSKWRARNSRKNPEILEFLSEMYPGVSLNSQIFCFLNGKSPYCEICGKVVIPDYRKKTCSIVCRENNTDQVSRMKKQKQTDKINGKSND